MPKNLYDGKAQAELLLKALRTKCKRITPQPSLCILQIGNDPISTTYVQLKKKRGEEIGMSIDIKLFSTANKETLQKFIEDHEDHYNGFILQLPLPNGEYPAPYLDLIPLGKDVDGLHSHNLEAIKRNEQTFLPAVVRAVEHIVNPLLATIDPKTVLILGKSAYVGQPVFDRLTFAFPQHTYIQADEFTENPKKDIAQADIVISCIGRAHIYSAETMKRGAALIDVGTSKHEDGTIKGDFITDKKHTAQLSLYTPVPGGVGPLTVTFLLENTILSSLGK